MLSRSKNEDATKVLRAIYGIGFFGTPHDGMNVGPLIAMVGDGPNRFLVESISSINSQILGILKQEFHNALGGQGDSEAVYFYETLLSPTAQQVGHNLFTLVTRLIKDRMKMVLGR